MPQQDIEFRLLGRLEAWIDGRPAALGGPRPRTLLALLLLERGRPIATSRLLDLIWDGNPPDSAAATVHVYIARLRKALGPAGALLRTTPLGYLLDVPPDSVDAARFETAVDQAQALNGNEPGRVADVLRPALSSWCGTLLADRLGDEPWAATHALRLTERHCQAVELWAQAEIDLGRPTVVIDELNAELANNPYREHLVALMMTALYRAGRQADALAAYDACRRRLGDDLGIDPSEELRDLHAAILEQRQQLHGRALAAPKRASTLPARTPRFRGREEIVGRVSAALAQHRFVACTGLNGVGKTCIALEVAHRHDGFVCWIAGDNDGALSSGLAALAGFEPTERSVDEREQVRRLWDDVAAQPNPMVVFDNVLHPDLLVGCLPPLDRVRVLVTSRDAAWGGLGKSVRVEPFTAEEAVEILLTRTGSEDGDAAAQLAEELGRLPLAVVQAASYIDESDLGINDYLQLLARRRAELLLRGTPVGSGGPVGTTWTVSFEQVAQQCPDAGHLLEAMAFLSPDGIPVSLLYPLMRRPDDPELKITDLIAQLRRYSLVDRDGPLLRVHRLVQIAARARLAPPDYAARLAEVLDMLQSADPGDPLDVGNARSWTDLVPHLLVAAGYADEAGTATVGLVDCLARAARHLRASAAYRLGEAVLDLAIALCRRLPSDPLLTARLRSDLGDLLDAAGDVWAAREEHLLAVEALEQALGAHDVNVARAKIRLGHVLNCAGLPAEAIKLYRAALAVLRECDADAAEGLIDLGYAQWNAGDLGSAHVTFCDALSLLDEHPRENRVAHAEAIAGLGMVCQDEGDLDTALQLHATAIDEFRAAHADVNHPDIGQAYDKLGFSLRLRGDIAGSLAAHATAERILTETFGEADPRAAMALTNRGLALLANKDVNAAITAQQRALAIFTTAYGLTHPHTKLAADRLAEARDAARPFMALRGDPTITAHNQGPRVVLREFRLPRGWWSVSS